MKRFEEVGMNHPLISVIVPVYKVEAYIDRCIQSIVDQSYENMEIILVDDGSPDKCPEICDSWAEKDSRIMVIHKKNGGLSSARNAGLDICKGEFISFVDSDDWIEPEMYEKLLDLCVKQNVKLAICGRWDVYPNTAERVLGKCPDNYTILTVENALKKVLIGDGCDSSACDKLFHRSLWKTFRFPEGKLYEDVALLYKVIIAAQQIVFCPEPMYNYYHREDSIVTSSFNSNLVDYPDQTAVLVSDVKTLYPQLTEYAVWTHVHALYAVLVKINHLSYASYKKNIGIYRKYKYELKKYCDILCTSALFSKRDRFLFHILIYEPLARFVIQSKKTIKNVLKKTINDNCIE